MKNKIDNLKNENQLKIGNMCVEMMYSKKSKSLDECILNIIKLKMK